MTGGPGTLRPYGPGGTPWEHMSAIEIIATVLTGAASGGPGHGRPEEST